MDVTLRPLRPDECEAAGALIGTNELWRRYAYSPERAAADLARAIAAGDLVLGAFAEHLLGLAWVMPAAGFGRSPYLKLLAVAPSEHSRGVGARLLEATLEHFRGKASWYFLLVSDFNEGAQRFYQRHGFAQVGGLPDFVLPGVSELIYWRRI